MTFLLDHDVPADLARFVARAGYQAIRIVEVLPPTSSDATVLEYAAQHELILITCNRDDFLKLAAQKPHAGLVILIRRKTRQQEYAHLLTLFRKAGDAGLRGNINFA